MALHGVLLVIIVAASAMTSEATSDMCPPCVCSGPDGIDISCKRSQMSMDMLGIPPNLPANTRSLDISNHGIRMIQGRRLAHLTQLQSLNLAGNRISTLDPAVFSSLTNLISLDLHGNVISSVNKDTFQGLVKLRQLDLSGNDLTTVSRGSFSFLPELVSLRLGNNPLRCNCSIAWILTFDPVDRSSLTCRSSDGTVHQVNTLGPEDLGCVVPSVSAVTAEVAAYEGKKVFLSCSVEGADVTELVWVANGQLVTGGDQSVQLLGNGSLEIVSMTADLAGQYTCVSTNMAGTGNATVTLRYLGIVMPRITTRPSHTHAFPGENVFLTCVGDHYADSYRWLHSGQLVMDSSRVHIVEDHGLNISNVTISDSGTYTCIAVGTEGSVQASAFLNVTGPLLSCQGVIDASTVAEIRATVNFAFNQSSPRNVTSPHQLLRRLKLPDDGSVELLVAGDVFQEALEIVRATHDSSEGGVPVLSECEVNLLAELSGCRQHTTTPDCSDMCYHSHYRTIDGSCNNWAHPVWGMVDTPLQRLLPPAYEDGLGRPVGWSGGLPSSREISQSVIRAHTIISDEHITHMLMQVGQFLDHDIDLTPGTPSDVAFSSGAMCDTQCTNTAPCFPIQVPDDDPRLLPGTCIPFTRSGGVCGTGPSSLLVGSSPYHREQLNVITSFLDASQIYGSNAEHAHRLRDPARPSWLLEGMAPSGEKPFLPFDEYSLIECNTGIHSERSDCFLAGDVRANEQVGLTVMHTLFFREHNRVVSLLSKVNQHWDQERLYQEARRIVVAEWQHIIYSEYLPTILGPSGVAILGDYHGYDPDINPSIDNAFATAAYRFGHSQILPVFQRLDEDYRPHPVGHLMLRDAFFAPFRLLEEGGVDPMVRGLIASAGKKISPVSGLNADLTEALFSQAHEVALDLAALNIQRGRDHGLPSYVKWREFCELSTQDPLVDIRNASVRQRLLDVYDNNVDNIDLWVGGLLESVQPDSQLGPTFSCIIAQQFHKLRAGDRFWYERNGQFTSDQLLELQQSSLSRIICDNTDSIVRVPRAALWLQPVSEFSECSELPSVDLNLWTDCQDDSYGPERRSMLMSGVAEEVRQLREAVADLQNNAASCVVNGVRYGHSEEWNMDPCRHCSCQMGSVLCEARTC